MTSSDMHFVAHLANVVTNVTAPSDTEIHILNATANEIINHTINGINATAQTIAAAKPSKLSRQMPWIELALIPIFPVIACYLFTKLADYLLDRITKHRHRETATRLGPPYRKMRAEMEATKPASVPAQDKKKMHLSTPNTRLRNSTLPHGTVESSRMAGANAENPVIIGNPDALEQGEAATLTRENRSRVFERGGVRGGVGSRSERGAGGQLEPREQLGGVRRRDSAGQVPVARVKAQGSGWWFDARWD